MAREYFLNPHKATNQFRKRENAYPSRLTGPLSNEQKARICILAREAADVMGVKIVSAAHLREWRMEQQFKAVGKQSLTECLQDDYLPLTAHFLNLAGKSVSAMNAHLKHGTEDKRIAFFKLQEICEERGISMAYAGAICRNAHKCTLNDATARQLWQLVFTVKNRSPKKVGQPKSAPAEYVPEFDDESNEPF